MCLPQIWYVSQSHYETRTNSGFDFFHIDKENSLLFRPTWNLRFFLKNIRRFSAEVRKDDVKSVSWMRFQVCALSAERFCRLQYKIFQAICQKQLVDAWYCMARFSNLQLPCASWFNNLRFAQCILMTEETISVTRGAKRAIPPKISNISCHFVFWEAMSQKNTVARLKSKELFPQNFGMATLRTETVVFETSNTS